MSEETSSTKQSTLNPKFIQLELLISETAANNKWLEVMKSAVQTYYKKNNVVLASDFDINRQLWHIHDFVKFQLLTPIATRLHNNGWLKGRAKEWFVQLAMEQFVLGLTKGDLLQQPPRQITVSTSEIAAEETRLIHTLALMLEQIMAMDAV